MALFKKSKKEDKTSKKEEKKTPKKETSSSKKPTNIYYLTMREEKGKKVGWEVKRGNAAKVSAFVKTKEEAKVKVKELAKNSEATVIIYKMDGSVEETYKIN